MFGREIRLPIDLLYGRPEPVPYSHIDYVNSLEKTLDEFMSSQGTICSFHPMKLNITTTDNITSTLEEFLINDAVWLHNPVRKKGITPKLTRNWTGPYLVVGKLSNLLYKIQLSARSKPTVVHRNRLWKYRGNNPPTWKKNEQVMC